MVFSKFYLEIDNETCRGAWVGWQIVQQYHKLNKEIFEKSK
jgi:hypothetical protein